MKKSVLVIDDEKDLCDLISRVLIKEGFDVICAFSLTDAVRKMDGPPDIIILDNNLPDGTGLEYIRMHPSVFRQSFIIMITADASTDLQDNAAYVGVGAFLTKPFSFARMKKILQTA